jgi:DNA repair protein RadD
MARTQQTLAASKYTLRGYQQQSVDCILEQFFGPAKDNGVLVLPTGAGKSLITGTVASEIEKKGDPLLVFQPSKEILAHNLEKYESYGGRAGVFSASFNRKDIQPVTFATIGSTVRKPDIFKHFKYVLIDECHKVNPKGGMYQQMLAELGKQVVGLTATPWRLSSTSFGTMAKFITRTNPREFHNVLHVVQTGEMFSKGFLSKLVYHDVMNFDIKKLRLNSTGVDYTDASVERYMEEINFEARLLQAVKRLLYLGRKPLVFTRFVAQSERLVNALRAEGVKESYVVTGETPSKERAFMFDGYLNRRIDVLANVGVLDTGADFPQCDAVVLASPMRGLSMYLQKVGRGARIHPDKKDCLIIDLCGTHRVFGPMEDIIIDKSDKGKWCATGMNRKLSEEVPVRRQLTNNYLHELIQ